MEIVVSSDILQKKLQLLNHAVSTRSQLPILSNILLIAFENSLVLKATDLEIGIEITLDAKVLKEGEITVAAKLFSELIYSLALEEIKIAVKEQTLTVSTKKTNSEFQTLPSSDFPLLYQETGEKLLDIPKKIIEEHLSQIIFAASSDIARPQLTGVLLQITEGGSLLLVATDGYRLSLRKIAAEKKSSEKRKLLIPARVLKELVNAKPETDVSLFASLENSQAQLRFDKTVLVGRLIEAEFPNYEKIIPNDFGTKITVDKIEFQKAVKTSSIFARDSSNIIKLSFGTQGIVVSANTAQVGQNTVEVDAKITGDENEIAFNARYVLELLGNLDCEEISFEMAGPLNPGVFKIVGDDSFLHLIMPIRVQV